MPSHVPCRGGNSMSSSTIASRLQHREVQVLAINHTPRTNHDHNHSNSNSNSNSNHNNNDNKSKSNNKNNDGASGESLCKLQPEARRRARALCDAGGLKCRRLPLIATPQLITSVCERLRNRGMCAQNCSQRSVFFILRRKIR